MIKKINSINNKTLLKHIQTIFPVSKISRNQILTFTKILPGNRCSFPRTLSTQVNRRMCALT